MFNNMNYCIKTLKCLFKIAGVRGLVDYFLSKIAKVSIKIKLYTTYAPGISEPIYIRIPS